MKRSADTFLDDSDHAPVLKSSKSQQLLIDVRDFQRRDSPKCFPNFRKPSQVGDFSIDKSRIFSRGADQQKVLNSNLVESFGKQTTAIGPVDLNTGYDGYSKEPDRLEYLDMILRWLESERVSESSSQLIDRKRRLNASFVTWRGQLTKVGATPYEFREPWQFVARKYQGTVFLAEVETECKRRQEENKDERQQRMCYWGYNFETFCCAKEGESEGRQPVNTNEAYCCVCRTRLEKHTLIYAGEVDCIHPQSKENIELKTTRWFDRGSRQEDSFHKFKLLKWWLQSFLLGVGHIISGMRDDEGIVQQCRYFPVLEIPKIANQTRAHWDGGQCLRFIDALLSALAAHVTDEGLLYTVDYDPQARRVLVSSQPGHTSPHYSRLVPDWWVAAASAGTQQPPWS